MSEVITPEVQKSLGVSLFNKVWDLIEKKDRSPQETEWMINAAHASLYHWLQVGEPVNFARGEWQVSRVYSLCARSEPALHHAENSLRICREKTIGDFDLAFAYEAVARAYMVKREPDQMREFLTLAKDAATGINKKEDHEYFLSELESIRL